MNDSNKPTVGVVGLGLMGSAMARTLLAKGFAVQVWNRTRSKMQVLVEAGARGAPNLVALAQRCQVIITCVSDTRDVEQVTLGDGALAGGAAPGTVICDCSTISPESTKRIASILAERKIAHLDCPVSGGPEGAAKGTLSIMVGGAAADLAKAQPVLAALGSSVIHVGEHGHGQLCKLANQVLGVGNMLAMAEALVFAAAHGLDLYKTLDALGGGAAGSWLFSNRGPKVLARDFAPGFAVELQNKDLRLALKAADVAGLALPATSLAHQLYNVLERAGLGGEGNHALVKAIEQLNRVEVKG